MQLKDRYLLRYINNEEVIKYINIINTIKSSNKIIYQFYFKYWNIILDSFNNIKNNITSVTPLTKICKENNNENINVCDLFTQETKLHYFSFLKHILDYENYRSNPIINYNPNLNTEIYKYDINTCASDVLNLGISTEILIDKYFDTKIIAIIVSIINNLYNIKKIEIDGHPELDEMKDCIDDTKDAPLENKLKLIELEKVQSIKLKITLVNDKKVLFNIIFIDRTPTPTPTPNFYSIIITNNKYILLDMNNTKLNQKIIGHEDEKLNIKQKIIDNNKMSNKQKNKFINYIKTKNEKELKEEKYILEILNTKKHEFEISDKFKKLKEKENELNTKKEELNTKKKELNTKKEELNTKKKK